MDDAVLNKIIDRCLDERSLERYVELAGRRATKTDTRAVARNVIPYMVTQLDSKSSRETRTAEKLHEMMMQAHDPATMEDPRFASSVVTTLLGSKKNEIIAATADEMMLHPAVVENMIQAFAPSVMRAYGAEFGKDVFRAHPVASILSSIMKPEPERRPAPPKPEPQRKPEPPRKAEPPRQEPRRAEPARQEPRRPAPSSAKPASSPRRAEPNNSPRGQQNGPQGGSKNGPQGRGGQGGPGGPGGRR